MFKDHVKLFYIFSCSWSLISHILIVSKTQESSDRRIDFVLRVCPSPLVYHCIGDVKCQLSWKSIYLVRYYHKWGPLSKRDKELNFGFYEPKLAILLLLLRRVILFLKLTSSPCSFDIFAKLWFQLKAFTTKHWI